MIRKDLVHGGLLLFFLFDMVFFDFFDKVLFLLVLFD